MDREIKFRVYHVDCFSYFTIGQTFTNEAKRKYDMICLNGMAFEQYTGLKDKNGVEIYEGDIIEWMGLRFYVSYVDYRFLGLPFSDNETTGYLCGSNFHESKVVGNIHEVKNF